jgi:hypothetical protein
MKAIIIILTMAMKAFAYEQMYALNCAGTAHTDSDGIVYQTRTANVRKTTLILEVCLCRIDPSTIRLNTQNQLIIHSSIIYRSKVTDFTC